MPEEKDDNYLQLTADTVTNKPLKEWTVKVKEYNWLDKLLKKPTERHFIINRCTVRNMVRCSGVAEKLPELKEQTGNLMWVVFPLIKNHMADVVYLIACGIQNNHKEPKKELINFIYDNFEDDDLYDCAVTILGNIGLQSFYETTSLIKGTSVVLAPDLDAKNAKDQD